MNDRLLLPFGFLRNHLLRQAARRDLKVMPDSGPGSHRVVAVGVGGPLDDCSVENQLRKLLPSIDMAFLFPGMAFERKARERSHAALLSIFDERDIPVEVIDQETALADLGPDASVFDSMQQISATLIERALASRLPSVAF